MKVIQDCRIRHYPRIKKEVAALNPRHIEIVKKWNQNLMVLKPELEENYKKIASYLDSNLQLPENQARVLLTYNFHPMETATVFVARIVAAALQEKGYEVVLVKLPYETSNLGLALRLISISPALKRNPKFLDMAQFNRRDAIAAEFCGFHLFDFHNSPLRDEWILSATPFSEFTPIRIDLERRFLIGPDFVEIMAIYKPLPEQILQKLKPIREAFKDWEEDDLASVSYTKWFGEEEGYLTKTVNFKATEREGLVSNEISQDIAERIHTLITLNYFKTL